MKRSRTTYTIFHADGSLEKVTIPDWMGDCHDVAKRLPHSLIFMHVKAKHCVYAETALSSDESLVTGPAIVYANADGRRVQVPEEPKSESHAMHLYRTYIGNSRKAA